MTTLTDKAILSSADNRPPMLEKDMYDSWKRRMGLYMMNRQHGRMILESIENSPLIWPTIEKNGVTRPTKYSELSATEANQVDCDIKATNIILQGLPPEVFALVSNHKVAKELWERIQLLMQGTSLTKQERSVENGPLIWSSIEENGVIRPKKYSELSPTEAIQADFDIKATNIILQGLSPEVYALVSNHKVAKELWERIQLLMQGTSLTKYERECKLYDEFDKFAFKKGETLRDFYLRFLLLLNDMNIYIMKLEQFQVNTKFLNTLPLEWRKFMTDVKLVWDFLTTNIDQLHAYLGQ
ncbi:hypothetical protein Tco_0476197, partial [Tanacetum coccineum]